MASSPNHSGLRTLSKEQLLAIVDALRARHPDIEPTLTQLVGDMEKASPLSPLSPTNIQTLSLIHEDEPSSDNAHDSTSLIGAGSSTAGGGGLAAPKEKKARKLSIFGRRERSHTASPPTELNALLFGSPNMVKRMHDRIHSNVLTKSRSASIAALNQEALLKHELPPHVTVVDIPASSGKAVVRVHCVEDDLHKHTDVFNQLMWVLPLQPLPSVIWVIDIHAISTAAGAQAGDLQAEIRLLKTLMSKKTFSSGGVCIIIETSAEFAQAAKYADFEQMWPDYKGGKNKKDAIEYVVSQFVQNLEVVGDVMVHTSDPNDKKLAKFIKGALQEVKIKTSLKAAGLG